MTSETMAEVEDIFELHGLTTAQKTIRLIKVQADDDYSPASEHLQDLAEDWIGTYSELTTSWTQDEAVELLNNGRDNSWDIPSTLPLLCNHSLMIDYTDPRFQGRQFDLLQDPPMHRSDLWPDNNNNWAIIDHHFKEEHHIDLTDHRINWNFDT